MQSVPHGNLPNGILKLCSFFFGVFRPIMPIHKLICILITQIMQIEKLPQLQPLVVFEVNRHHVALAALDALAARGQVAREVCAQALQRYGIDAAAPQPWGV